MERDILGSYCTLDRRGSVCFYINEAFGLQIQTLVSGFYLLRDNIQTVMTLVYTVNAQ